MREFNKTYGRYPGFYTDWIKNGEDSITVQKPMPQHMMLPDIVLDVLQDTTSLAVKPIFEQHLKAIDVLPPLNRHSLFISEPQITWSDSCALVTQAFRLFNVTLGDTVVDILSDALRYRLEKAAPGEAGGYCAPPGWQGYERAKINYFYDGTINDAVYLAHELGHLLAADFAQEHGYRGEDAWMPRHVSEVPAMFAQCILYDYLMNGQEDALLQKAARKHFTGEMTRSLYEQQIAFALNSIHPFSQDEYDARMQTSLGKDWASFSKAKDKQCPVGNLHWHVSAATIGAGFYFSGLGRNPAVFDTMFKQGEESDILDLFEQAGIGSEQSLTGFFSRAVEAIKKPLEEICLSNNSASRKFKKAAILNPY